MTLRVWMKENRLELDTAIARAMKVSFYRLNDHQRRLWVLNDEGLYNWAKSDGVRL